MTDIQSINNCLWELEDLTLYFEGLDEILSMLYDSAVNGAFSADSYDSGIWLITRLSNEYTKRLIKIKDALYKYTKTQFNVKELVPKGH